MSTFNRHREFSNTREMEQAVATYGWDVSYTRLGPGKLGVASWETRVGDLLLYREHFEFPMLACGLSPADAYSVMTVQAGSMRVFGSQLSPQKVCLFPLGAEIDASAAGGLSTFHIQISSDRLAAWAKEAEVDLIQEDNLICVAPGADRIRHLKSAMQQASEAHDERDVDTWKTTKEDLLNLLTAVFDKEAIAQIGFRKLVGPAGEHAVAVRRHIHSSPLTELDIPGFADALGISHRHLNRCFKQHYGISIKDFIRYRRLQEARNLLHENAAGLSVTEAAYSCGFRHLGRFSTEYKQLFGESPRETLLQPSP